MRKATAAQMRRALSQIDQYLRDAEAISARDHNRTTDGGVSAFGAYGYDLGSMEACVQHIRNAVNAVNPPAGPTRETL
jgi:hypothetical protein